MKAERKKKVFNIGYCTGLTSFTNEMKSWILADTTRLFNAVCPLQMLPWLMKETG
jgi:hypothetical protein